LKTKQKQYELLLRKRTQLSIEKRMRKASKTERGWRRRFEFSVAVAQQGEWEQRLDQRANIYFFHRIPEDPEIEDILSESCQWEVPVVWSGDVLLTTDQKNLLNDTLDPSLNMNSQANQDSAFTQPSEIWLPHPPPLSSSLGAPGDMEMRSVHTSVSDDRTPGVKASGVIRSGQTKGGSRIGTSAVDGSSLVGFSSSFTRTLKDQQLQPPLSSSQPMKPNQSISTATGVGGIAEDLLLNDDIVYALARRLGLSTEKIVPVSQLPSVFTMSQEGDDSTIHYQPFSSLQSASLNEGTTHLLPLTSSLSYSFLTVSFSLLFAVSLIPFSSQQGSLVTLLLVSPPLMKIMILKIRNMTLMMTCGLMMSVLLVMSMMIMKL
jgi:hypothetical protein